MKIFPAIFEIVSPGHIVCAQIEIVVVSMTKPKAPKLLLSDLPIHWEGGVNSDKFFIHMPIAPDRLFIGTASEATEKYLNELPTAELIQRVNRSSLASSSRRIWGSDSDEGRAFIEANLNLIGANVVTFDALAKRFRASKLDK